jgi:hypothetical protein
LGAFARPRQLVIEGSPVRRYRFGRIAALIAAAYAVAAVAAGVLALVTRS